MPRDKRRSLRWLDACLLGYWLVHLVIFHWPTVPNLPGGGNHPWDFLIHGTAYTIFGWLTCVVVESHAVRRGETEGRGGRAFLSWLGVVLYGLLDEATQPLTGRTFDLDDWTADIVGTTLGVLVFLAAQRRRNPVE